MMLMTLMGHRRSIALAACAVGAAVAAPVASGAGRVAHKPKPVVKKVQVSDNFYAPTKVTITKGGSVNWVWNKTNFNTHNVTLIKGPKGIKKAKFTSIDGARGLHFKRTFTTPGTYHFECPIHPSMNVAVTVKR
jgi:plastocyanin